MSEINFNIVVCYNNPEQFENLQKCLKGQIFKLFSLYNEDNQYTIPSAYNEMSKTISAGYIIYIHQDVIVPHNWLNILETQIKIIEKTDKHWGAVGVMGVKKNGLFAGHIVDPHTNFRIGHLPSRVATLDEVCLIIRKDSPISFDEKLGGYHFYGADICMQARQAKLKCYAIDAPLEHLSGGKVDNAFWTMAERLKNKWSPLEGVGNTIETTCGIFKLNNNVTTSIEYLYKILRRKIFRRLQKRTIA